MNRRRYYMPVFLMITLMAMFTMPNGVNVMHADTEDDGQSMGLHKEKQTAIELKDETVTFQRFTYDSGLDFDYPDAVRGIYVTGTSAGGSRFDKLVDLVDTTDLNTMVIDIKEDHGNLTFKPEEGSPYEDMAQNFIKEPRKMLEKLEEKGIYPVARIVVFKDTVLANKHPEWSFKEQNGQVWSNGKGDSFVNPFMEEVWDYNVDIAKRAAELGFQEIQFDYVRFPEGFEHHSDQLDYSMGEYADFEDGDIKRRVEAVTDFVKYAGEELDYYDVDVGVDVFGYAADVVETPGIGQNFLKLSENIDVISSMIYPSHWGPGYFDIDKPDQEPYNLVDAYAKTENELLEELDDKKPTSRPWIQDFEAPWLYSGPAKQYGKAEVEAQIQALYDNDISEYLLWNAGNSYTPNVDYKNGK